MLKKIGKEQILKIRGMCFCSSLICTGLFWCLCRWCRASDASLPNIPSFWRQNI